MEVGVGRRGGGSSSTPPTKNVPGGDLEGGTKDLRSYEFRHDEDEESVDAAVGCALRIFEGVRE